MGTSITKYKDCKTPSDKIVFHDYIARPGRYHVKHLPAGSEVGCMIQIAIGIAIEIETIRIFRYKKTNVYRSLTN